MTKYEIIKNMTCTNSLTCILNMLQKLETPILKLHADNENDIVNGSITVLHEQNNHKIEIEIYDIDELPNDKRKSSLKRPTVIPTKKVIEALL